MHVQLSRTSVDVSELLTLTKEMTAIAVFMQSFPLASLVCARNPHVSAVFRYCPPVY